MNFIRMDACQWIIPQAVKNISSIHINNQYDDLTKQMQRCLTNKDVYLLFVERWRFERDMQIKRSK